VGDARRPGARAPAQEVANLTRGSTLAGDLVVADRFVSRLAGLAFTRSLPRGRGILISPCNWIHTAFMRYPIDVVYLDDRMRVVALAPSVRPWRLGKPVWRARDVLELPEGTIAATGTCTGDRLAIRPAPGPPASRDEVPER